MLKIRESQKGQWSWVCPICSMEIKPNEDIWQCAYCFYIVHLEEALNWISERGKCPFCQKETRSAGRIIKKR